jgi:hypothetical protein
MFKGLKIREGGGCADVPMRGCGVEFIKGYHFHGLDEQLEKPAHWHIGTSA